MKTMKNQTRQGDVLIERIKSLPANLKKATSLDGRVIIAHSETGHHHYFDTTKSLDTQFAESGLLDQVLEETCRFQNINESFAAMKQKKAEINLFTSDKPTVSFLEIKNAPAVLVHGRSWDTHESVMFGPGVYQISRQQEKLPEGWRVVQD